MAILAGVLSGADAWEAVALLSREYPGWLNQFLPAKFGVPHAQTICGVFRLLKPEVLEECLASKVTPLRDVARVIAIDGKTPRGSKKSANGSGAAHLLSAHAGAAGLVIGSRAGEGKSNAIKAIPELLEIRAIKGAIRSIDAIGTP